jgi:hypothetical protein
MGKRVCYIHIGPHKTGTSAIQWFLKQNRAELLKLGYFVPESGTARGAHHPIARDLCGEPLPERKKFAAAKFAHHVGNTPSNAVIISSEALAGLLREPEYGQRFFARISELNLLPKLLVFPRNQPQWINSRYADGVRSCTLPESFESFALRHTERLSSLYSPFFALADTYNAELISRPFTTETMANNVVPTFLRAVGIDPGQFTNITVRRNEAAGPFTVAALRGVSRALAAAGKTLKWRQATKCKSKLTEYLEKKGLADSGYCGLTTELARQFEEQCRADNDTFAQRAWGAHWQDVFADDVGRDFQPNDFDVSPPDEAREQLLAKTVTELMAVAEGILRDPGLAVDEPWNDLQQRKGWAQESATNQGGSTEAAATI